MNINATIIGQSLAFIIFIWFCMKYVWPPIIKILDERKERISDGLVFAEKAEKKISEAKKEAEYIVMCAQKNASDIITKANKRASLLVEQAKFKAKEEVILIKKASEQDIAKEKQNIKDELKSKVALLAVQGARAVVEKNLDEQANSELVDRIVADL